MRPKREAIQTNEYAYFVSTQTKDRTPFFRHDRWAQLMVATIKHCSEEHFLLHAFVVMPDHLHLLLTPNEAIEKAVQLVKGGFSFKTKKELAWNGDIWQPGFTDHRIRDEEDWNRHLTYIRQNPVDARLADTPVLYRWAGFPNIAFPQRLKPLNSDNLNVRAKARTLHSQVDVRTGTAETVPFQSFPTAERGRR